MNLLHFSVGYPRTEMMGLLELSARENRVNVVLLPDEFHQPRIRTIDKFHFMRAIIDGGSIADMDIILFTDAYDVLVIDDKSKILREFLHFSADLVFNAECALYPDDDRDAVRRAFDLVPSKWRYLNSGCYIGYAWAVRAMLDYVMARLPDDLSPHYLDQQLAQDFYLAQRGGATARRFGHRLSSVCNAVSKHH